MALDNRRPLTDRDPVVDPDPMIDTPRPWVRPTAPQQRWFMDARNHRGIGCHRHHFLAFQRKPPFDDGVQHTGALEQPNGYAAQHTSPATQPATQPAPKSP